MRRGQPTARRSAKTRTIRVGADVVALLRTAMSRTHNLFTMTNSPQRASRRMPAHSNPNVPAKSFPRQVPGRTAVQPINR
jgi:hypothetical protein